MKCLGRINYAWKLLTYVPWTIFVFNLWNIEWTTTFAAMQGALNGIDHNLYGMMYVTFLGTIKSFESVWTITFKTFHTIIWTFTIVFTWVLVAGTNWERRCLQPLSALMNYYIKCFKYCGGYRINVPVKKRCLYQLHNRVSRVNVQTCIVSLSDAKSRKL